MQHYLLLSRNLLYIGLTRVKQLAVLVGPMKTIGFTVKRIVPKSLVFYDTGLMELPASIFGSRSSMSESHPGIVLQFQALWVCIKGKQKLNVCRS